MEIRALEQGVAGGMRGGEWKMIGLIEDTYDEKSTCVYILDENFLVCMTIHCFVCDCECIRRRRC